MGVTAVRKLSILLVLITFQCIVFVKVLAQQFPGEVSGWLTGGVNKYHGDFTDDLWGASGMVSLQYAPISRLGIEVRAGLGEIRWMVSPSKLSAYPEYFGSGARYGMLYPGTGTPIESENESRLTTVDLLLNYTLVENIPAIPFISAGVGLVDFAPSTSDLHEPLPNFSRQVFSATTVSIPIGGGVRIPFSYRAGIILRGEYRFVFSGYLDDVNFNGSNDGVTSISLGFTYRFTNPPSSCRHRHHHHHPTACVCSQLPNHSRADCPCIRFTQPGGITSHSEEIIDYPVQRDESSGQTTDPRTQNDGVESTGSLGSPDSTSTTKNTTPQRPPNSNGASGNPEPQTPDDSKGPAEKDTKPGGTSDNSHNLAPCPPGTIRTCIGTDSSVCVDPTFKPGSQRIMWEDAFVYMPGSPYHMKTLRQIGDARLCFDNVVRQSAGVYYLCQNCCFNRKNVGTSVEYNVHESDLVTKGTGSFSPTDCPGCKKMIKDSR